MELDGSVQEEVGWRFHLLPAPSCNRWCRRLQWPPWIRLWLPARQTRPPEKINQVVGTQLKNRCHNALILQLWLLWWSHMNENFTYFPNSNFQIMRFTSPNLESDQANPCAIVMILRLPSDLQSNHYCYYLLLMQPKNRVICLVCTGPVTKDN